MSSRSADWGGLGLSWEELVKVKRTMITKTKATRHFRCNLSESETYTGKPSVGHRINKSSNKKRYFWNIWIVCIFWHVMAYSMNIEENWCHYPEILCHRHWKPWSRAKANLTTMNPMLWSVLDSRAPAVPNMPRTLLSTCCFQGSPVFELRSNSGEKERQEF